MRIRISFKTTSPNTRVMLSYNSKLASSVESWFSGLSARMEPGCFVFSRIIVKSKVVNFKSSAIRLFSPSAHIYVSLCNCIHDPEPAWDSIIGRPAGIGLDGGDLIVESVQRVEEPSWTRSMRFRMLSPAAVRDTSGNWMMADSPLLGSAIRSDLLERYAKAVGGPPPEDDEFEAAIDENYVSQRGGGSGVMKVIRLDGSSENPAEVQAFLCPIVVSGNPELIAYAHRTGIGSLGSKGLGMMG